jgi:hypothetical protein
MSLFNKLAIMLLIALATSCTRINDPEEKPGHLVVRLTDAPAAYSEVNISFSEISAHIDSNWITVTTEPQKINLLDWNSGKSIILGEADVPAGHYTQIRLKINDADVLYNGTSYPLDVPSGATSGLKFGPQFTVESGSTYELVIDFDAERSVVTTGPPTNPKGFKLKPHIRVVPLAVTGSISGKVTNPQHVPIVYAIQDSDTLTTSRVDTLTGLFTLGFLENGLYSVAVDDTLGLRQEINDIKVSAGQEAQIGELTLE